MPLGRWAPQDAADSQVHEGRSFELSLYEEMLGLSRQQTEAIKDGDMERLNSIIEAKDRLIKRISGMEKPQGEHSLCPEALANGGKCPVNEKIAAVIKEILAADKANQDLLAARMAEVKEEIRNVRASKAKVSGRLGAQIQAPRFIDRSC